MDIRNIQIQFDAKPKATIGLVQIPSDMVLDTEVGPLLCQVKGVLWRITKMKFEEDDSDISEATYLRAAKNIAQATKSFLPADKTSYGSIDVMALCCTSLSFTLGSAMVQSELLSGYPWAPAATDMASAVASAIKAVCPTGQSPNIALLTPYITSIHMKNVKFLNEHGINVVVEHNLGFTNDTETSAMSPSSIFECSKALASAPSTPIDAIFIGCSGFKSTGYGFIDRLETETGKPVITSNQALLWRCLTLCEQITPEDICSIKGYGQLFSHTT